MTEKEILKDYLLQIGILYKRCIEIGGTGIDSILTDLIFDYNFHGLFFDINDKKIYIAIDYYRAKDKLDLITLVNGKVTVENISFIIKSLIKYNNNYIDVLVVNIKNNGYWILKEFLKYIYPRIIIIKYQPYIPPDRALIVPFDPCFNYKEYGDLEYYGASIKAYTLLLKDYKCVYYNNSKAFFISTIEKSIDYNYDKKLYNKFLLIKDLPWIDLK